MIGVGSLKLQNGITEHSIRRERERLLPGSTTILCAQDHSPTGSCTGRGLMTGDLGNVPIHECTGPANSLTDEAKSRDPAGGDRDTQPGCSGVVSLRKTQPCSGPAGHESGAGVKALDGGERDRLGCGDWP